MSRSFSFLAALLRRPERAAQLAGATFAAGAVMLLAFEDGGYFPGSWRAATAACASAAALSLVLRGGVSLTRPQVVSIGAMAALCAWTALSALWAVNPDTPLEEAQRTLLYVTLLTAAVLLRRGLLAGTLVGIVVVCAYSVGRRLVDGPPDPPDPFEGTLLQEPLGYANALGALAAVGLALAVAVLFEQPRLRAVLAAAAALLGVTLVLTGSRGGWAAAGVGAAVAFAVALGRLRLARAVLAVAAVALVTGLALSAGSPADDLARHAGDRPFYWYVAWREAADAPVLGSGAGTFELSWLERRPVARDVRDAHSLYLETAAELGVVGLTLLALALAPSLLAGLRNARRSAAAGGYAAFLFHAGIDWDWEMAAVTAAGLLCGAALLVEAGTTRRASSGATEHLSS